MFILHSSNKTENLAGHLAAVLEHAPLESPFAEELFLIQSSGMERWLFQQLAQRFGIWANYRFLFPDHFFSFIGQQLHLGSATGAFERKLLLWRLESALRQLNDKEAVLLQAYLSGQHQALKRFQLARQLTQIFDQYQIMRPDMLQAWQQGRLLYDTSDERWQRGLWLALTGELGRQHRGSLWLDAINKLDNAPENSLSKQLPERVSIFGINTLPPLFLNYLQSLSRHCQIHLFLLNPAQTFWADLASKRQRAQDNSPNAHPLLSSLGQQGREFQEMLLELAQFDYQPESFISIEQPNNLQQLQNDILNNHLLGETLSKDASLSIHACHSRKREIEVLKDQLLMALENDRNLELRDIAVMAPDIQLYEPFIAAAFHDIQHAIADRSLRLANKTLDAFLRFLELSQSRLGWQSVLDVLELEAVYPAFGLAGADLESIKYWVQETNVRWGESGAHKAELGLPPLAENTWQAALERLLMGYAVSDDEQFVLGILPYKNIEGSSAAALGGLHDFLTLLFQARRQFQHSRSLASWGELLEHYAARLLKTDALAQQPLQELFLELKATLSEFHHEAVELIVIQHWLEDNVTETKSSQGFLRGQLTFCSMLPMRSIPFKVIAVLGLNEGEFPKVDRAPTFDLISQHFRKGDRSRRKDDRYQFLEILLSARQQLILSYVGQSQSSNDKIPPSVAVSELLAVLGDYYQLNDLVTYHPLQAFSPRNFDHTTSLFSFSQANCATARALSTESNPPVLWWTGSLSCAWVQVIELSDLFNFFNHPQRYFFRTHFGMRCRPIETEIEEREAFALAQLASYSLMQEWTEALLKDKPLSAAILRAQGRWMSGVIGDIEFSQRQQAMTEFAGRIKALNAGERLPAQRIDLRVGDYRLAGQIPHNYSRHNLLYRCAPLKGKDFLLGWLSHLIVNADTAKKTYLVSSDQVLTFEADHCPQAHLTDWLNIYLDGRRRPDAFFSEAAFKYMQQACEIKHNGRAKTPPLRAAGKVLEVAFGSEYELELRQLFGLIENGESILTEQHCQQWDELLVPVWEKLHDN